MVVLKALIDSEGNVEDVERISGEPALASAATEAVKQWKYKPYLLNGQPVSAQFEISINFSLAGS
jgi:periplasmic protein TonB